MKTITETTEVSCKIKGSEFIGYLFSIESKEDFDQQLAAIRKEHSTATHHCPAYRLFGDNPTEFSSDDGEPSGTAGRPMMNTLRSNDLVDAGVIVVRYFGGTKLGKAGLIDAYAQTTASCLQNATLRKITPSVDYRLQYPYNRESAIRQLINTFDAVERQAEYLESITKTVACPASKQVSFEKELKRMQNFDISSDRTGANYIIAH